MSGAGVAFEFDGKTYHVEPKAFSTDCVDAVERMYDLELRSRIKEVAKELAAAGTEQERQVMRDCFGIFNGRMEKFSYQVQRTTGLATVLHICSPDIATYEEALQIVRGQMNVAELVGIVMNATGIAESGN